MTIQLGEVMYYAPRFVAGFLALGGLIVTIIAVCSVM